MSITRNDIDLAIEEFGDEAYKQFECNSVIGTVHPRYWFSPKSNSLLLDVIDDPSRGLSHVKFKPAEQLFAHDVDVYGENAYLMLECIDRKNAIKSNYDVEIELVYAPELLKRKESAALPFDLERARKGDIIKYQMMPEKTFRFVSMYDEEHVLINDGVQPVNDITHISLLYHPYPPKQPA